MTAALFTLLAAAAPAEQLREVQAELAREQAAAARLAHREASIISEVDAAERAYAAARAAWKKAKARNENAAEAAAAAERALLEADARWQEAAAQVSPRLRARARLGAGAERARVLAGAGTVASAVRTTRALDRLLADDLAALRALRDAQEDRTVRRGVAEAARVEAAAALEEAQQARAEAERTAGERKALLAVVRRERGLRERMAAELLAAAVDLEEELKRLKAGPPSGPSFETLKGALPHPCEGPVEVGFGRRVDPRFGTVTLQKGWDIRAAEGTPVYAVASATVRHAGWFRGYGNLLILDHGGGWYTLYAHLGALMRVGGERVEIGEQLGEVGDTGSLKGPYLYFEVRNGQKALDPAEWVPVPVR